MKAHQGRDLLTIQAAILGPHYSTLEVALHDFRMARELGLIASMHQGGGPARTPDGWERLEAAGLLGDHVNIVHGHALTMRSSQRFCELGMSFSAAAESEMSQGHGHPLTGRLRRFGRAPSLGVDLESVLSGDMLTQARIALGIQRSLDNVAYREAHGTIPPTSTITTREALAWVTRRGRADAEAVAPDRIARRRQAGRPRLIRADDLNMQPVHDPVTSVVFQASLANIDSVMVAGAGRSAPGDWSMSTWHRRSRRWRRRVARSPRRWNCTEALFAPPEGPLHVTVERSHEASVFSARCQDVLTPAESRAWLFRLTTSSLSQSCGCLSRIQKA